MGATEVGTNAATNIAVLVMCGDQTRHVYATIESLARQSSGRPEIVLLVDSATPETARAWLTSFASSHRFFIEWTQGRSIAAVKNAAVRQTAATLLTTVFAGDLLDRDCLPRIRSAFEANDAVEVVTSWMCEVLSDGRHVISGPDDMSLKTALTHCDVFPGATAFRRKSWERESGFNESLPALEDYELCLRLLQTPDKGSVVAEPLLIRYHRQHALYRTQWRPAPRAEAVRLILEAHRMLLEENLQDALYVRHRLLKEFRDRNHAMLTQRALAERELARLDDRVRELLERLPFHEVTMGDLRRTTPISSDWGYERGTPIDRHYIEQFLAQSANDIAGTVLEVQESDYTKRFGGQAVRRSDVIDLDPQNHRATVIGDLRDAPNIPDGTYNCIILTQTLHVIAEAEAVVSECYRILKPGGVLLCTLPCTSRVSEDYGLDGDHWRFTAASARGLFGRHFPMDAVQVEARGNVLVGAAFSYGLATRELTEAEFAATDSRLPLLLSVRACKPLPPPRVVSPGSRQPSAHAVVLVYHRVGRAESDIHRLTVTAAAFKAQLTALCKRYRPMPLLDLVDAAETGSLSRDAVALTFDDGYADNFENAAPILAEFGVRATFFVTTAGIGRPFEYWWDVLERCILSPTAARHGLLSIELSDGPRTFAVESLADRQTAYWAVYRDVISRSCESRDSIIRQVMGWAGTSEPYSGNRLMRVEELVGLASEGHDVGAHSVHHLMLPSQPTEVQLAELSESKSTLETAIGQRVRTFAYPFGAVSEEVAGRVGSLFEVGVTCEEATVDSSLDRRLIPRITATQLRSADLLDYLAHRRGGGESRA